MLLRCTSAYGCDPTDAVGSNVVFTVRLTRSREGSKTQHVPPWSIDTTSLLELHREMDTMGAAFPTRSLSHLLDSFSEYLYILLTAV